MFKHHLKGKDIMFNDYSGLFHSNLLFEISCHKLSNVSFHFPVVP